MIPSTKHSKNLFQLIDGIYNLFFEGHNSTIKMDEYFITISNVSYTPGGDTKTQEKFTFQVDRIGEGKDDKFNVMTKDLRGGFTVCENGIVASPNNYGEFYKNKYGRRCSYLNENEINEVLTKLKRKYNLEQILD